MTKPSEYHRLGYTCSEAIIKAYNDEFYIETTASYDEFNDEVTVDDIKEHSKTYTCD